MFSKLKKIKTSILKKRLVKRFKKIGVDCDISLGIYGKPNNITIGNYVYIGPDGLFAGSGGIEIGDGTIIGPRVTIHSSNHNFDSSDLKSIPYDGTTILRKVSIGNNVWIGDSVMIAPGTIIGDGAVVGMGSVVSGIIPQYAVVVGNPGKVVKERDKERYLKLLGEQKIYLKEKFRRNIEYRKIANTH